MIKLTSFSTGRLLASWTLFADPVDRIALVNAPDAGVLHDKLLCTSCEGTVAVISLEELEQ